MELVETIAYSICISVMSSANDIIQFHESMFVIQGGGD
jgi:hypothetical protein